MTSAPKVFLSFAFEDMALAGKIAHTLQAGGVDTWWAEWCISAGDSIRQRIDDGLQGCTHFVVLLTPNSIEKPWVNAEIDAGLIRKLSLTTKFIPLRSGLPASALSPLLQGMLSPEIDPHRFDLAQLISDIHGVSRKPPLGPPPAVHKIPPAVVNTGLSVAAMAVARLFVMRSKYGKPYDPVFTLPALAVELQLTEEDTQDAVCELHPFLRNYRDEIISPEDSLFVVFDPLWLPWSSETDALKVASGLVNDPDFPKEQEKIADYFEWPARRLNPAISYLAHRGLIIFSTSKRGDQWNYSVIMKNDETRRFVKNHG